MIFGAQDVDKAARFRTLGFTDVEPSPEPETVHAEGAGGTEGAPTLLAHVRQHSQDMRCPPRRASPPYEATKHAHLTPHPAHLAINAGVWGAGSRLSTATRSAAATAKCQHCCSRSCGRLVHHPYAKCPSYTEHGPIAARRAYFVGS